VRICKSLLWTVGFQQPKEEKLQEQDPLGLEVSDTKISLNDTVITTR
jgi:hypothetical protein